MHALVLFLLTLLPAPPAAPTCLTSSGKTACGYHCRAAHGEVACAHTSAGVCDATEKKLVCWDPSDSVRAHYGDDVPRPECLTRGIGRQPSLCSSNDVVRSFSSVMPACSAAGIAGIGSTP